MLNNKEWISKLDVILKKFKINPKKYSLYLEAFTHQSYSYANKLKYNYQKLEFLGDAVIAWITSKFLYSKMNDDEGIMSQVKSNLVNGKMLAEISKSLNFDQLIIIGGGLNIISDKILEDVFESFIGAVYEDQGYIKAKTILEEVLISKFETDHNSLLKKSPKSEIQEFLMKNVKCNSNAIHYRNTKNEDESWTSEIVVNNIVYGKGTAKKAKEAENNAASDALQRCVKY